MKSPSLGQILTLMDQQNKIEWKSLSPKQAKTLRNIMKCHTAEAGFTSSRCEACGHTEIHYGSCNDPSCPCCGVVKREEWAEKQGEKMIDVCHFHIIFTVPDSLNPLILHDREYLYNAMFKASELTLKELAASKKHLGIEKCGFYSVLHSWGSNMSFHPHIHTVFAGGGMDENGEFKRSKSSFLFPAKKAAALFQSNFLKIASSKYEYSGSPWLDAFHKARDVKWNVQIVPAGDREQVVIEYLGRYVNRTAISNGRILSYDGDQVTFTWKDYRDHSKMKVMSLKDTEFLRRFVMHIAPEYFRRTRYYGFYSDSGRKTLEEVREKAKQKKKFVRRDKFQILTDILGWDVRFCRECGVQYSSVEMHPMWNKDRIIDLSG